MRKFANHIWTPRFVWTFLAFPCKTRARGRKFIRTGGFRCGSRTFAWTSHVSDWIVGRGTDTNRKSLVIWNRGARIARISPKSLSREAQITLSNRTICDLNLCSNRRWNRNADFLYDKSEQWAFLRRFTLSQIASDLRFAIRIANRNRSQIARFGALSPDVWALMSQRISCPKTLSLGCFCRPDPHISDQPRQLYLLGGALE